MSLISQATGEGFRCVAPVGDWCGEAPLWSARHGVLYWADINRNLVHRLRIEDSAVCTWFFPEPVTALALTPDENVLAVVLASKVVLWNIQRDTTADAGFALPGWPKVRMNDGRADPRGSLWLGTMRNNIRPDGSNGDAGGTDGLLYRMDPDGSVSVWEEGIGIGNTIAWGPGADCFYFADTLANRLSHYRYDISTGAITEKRPFLEGFSRGWPDGSAVDAEGYLWNCRYGGGCIVRVAPDGSIDNVIDFPGMNPTNCAFGGDDLKTLYVTSAGIDVKGDRLAGGLFAMDAGVRGLAENRFAMTLPAELFS